VKKILLFALLLTFVLCFSATVSADSNESAPLSPALKIIASDSGMAKSGIVGKDLVFTEDDFCRALNLSRVNYITVTSLPDSLDGRLLLGTTAVSVGQKISRTNLALLVFVPSTLKKTESCFSFSVENRGYEIKCSVYTLPKANYAPSAAHPSDASLTVSAFSGGATRGKLAGYDPEGDELCFEITRYPYHGLLILNDNSNGAYTYYPKTGFSGGDSFSYVVKDKYGNYSASSTVILTVSKSSGSGYSDMSGHLALSAALELKAAGIMYGKSDGVFAPDGSVTREELLVMAMKAAGISDLPRVDKTVFEDDAEISLSAKPYVAAAKQLGYVSGTAFEPKEIITRAEAALLVDRIIGGSAIVGNSAVRPVFNDINSIPSSAWTALSNLHLLGMIDDTNGNIDASGILTRADAAVMLAGILRVSK